MTLSCSAQAVPRPLIAYPDKGAWIPPRLTRLRNYPWPIGRLFDSPEHLFEVKWDGVRAVAAVEDGGYRIWGRDLADYGPRYPELDESGKPMAKEKGQIGPPLPDGPTC